MEKDSTAKKMAGWQVGNMAAFTPGPLTFIGVAVDYFINSEDSKEVYDIPVRTENNIRSKPKNFEPQRGGENMTLADRLETLELGQEDHYDAVERMDRALEENDDARDAASTVAEEFAEVYGLQGDAAEAVTTAMTDYLLDHREYMDDKTVELLENAEETREALDGIDVPNYDDVMDAVHVAARIDRKTQEEYDFNF